jgi:hypothetical protein
MVRDGKILSEQPKRIIPVISINLMIKSAERPPQQQLASECVVLPAKRGVAKHPVLRSKTCAKAAERSGINSIL